MVFPHQASAEISAPCGRSTIEQIFGSTPMPDKDPANFRLKAKACRQLANTNENVVRNAILA